MLDTELKDKLCIVTGSSGTVGSALVETLLSENAIVIGCDLNCPTFLVGANNRYRHITGDVNDKSTLDSLVRAIGTNKIHGFVPCAAKGPYSDDPSDILRTNYLSIAHWLDVLYDFFGEWGAILLVGSTAALRASDVAAEVELDVLLNENLTKIKELLEKKGVSPRIAYLISKRKLLLGTRLYARNFFHKRVRVNYLVLGPTPSNMNTLMRGSSPEIWNEFIQEMPFAEPNSPIDVARLMTCCLSDFTRMMTGSVICLDGGWQVEHTDVA